MKEKKLSKAKAPAAPKVGAFTGCLLGGALGDALGYQVEFTSGAEIERLHGSKTPTRINFDGGTLALISDDTQMTLFTAEGLIRAAQRGMDRGICHPPSIVGFALLRWHSTQEDRPPVWGGRGWLVDEPQLHQRRAPGNTCLSALRELDPGGGVPTVDKPPNDSKGCGAVMRAAPCGLAAGTRERAFGLARDTGVLTHGHPSGYLAGAYLAAVIWDLARGESLLIAMTLADRLLAKEKGCAELERILARTWELAKAGPPGRKTIEALGGGWVGEEALAIALLCALTFEPGKPRAVEAALWRAAAHGGDSDSTAAIAGNLIGVMVGTAGLPKRWLGALELRTVIARVARDLHASCVKGRHLEMYPPS